MDQIANTFEAFNRLRVLIIGDVMIDRYLRGRVQRISPEAPVPVVQWQDNEDRLGGAANVALNIKAMGATPYLFSVIGKDDNQHSFLTEMQQNGLDDRGIILSGERVTTVKTRVIAQNQHLLRVDKEDTHDLSEKEADHLLARLTDCLEEFPIDVIIFQDYNKGVLRPDLIRTVIDLAEKRQIPTVVDPKFKNFWNYRNVTLFKPNLREIQDQLSFRVAPEADSLLTAARVIRERLNNRISLVTLSDKGLFAEQNGQYHLLPTQARNIADVCGAGDTVISVVSLGLALGLPLEEIGQLANLAGGQVCEKVGVVPVDKAQLQREFANLAV
ncbi:bifunctional heptose 7-phosphate kinase/heptose 1-phosphate adenyltransferase [Flavilitoribacter nigricans]|uniref:Carbohydrate kinase n=1 Tax=Flavilitoribacter nigricans (strain ATCC 23147 / DSM 23189 / NBRC 102662 / NCIMB 1420 / SS-2) TaxID=1122177 RepID=A0A2D0NE32_FLAN2|nr:bifunctional ADP-heptose synthase [Flavilitoribacter nigricans]PHN06727.1 carbohydrate kinase [Flavilitoribacter nigricans DSM 23189 = NBRC 102662]